MPTLFFSYSHKDEPLRNQLEIHLSGLKRQGVISSWHDRRIPAGTEFGDAIDAHIATAEVILLLVSPDFIASDYCYEREMQQAMEKQRSGQAKVIPVILRPCDWHDLAFGKLLAAPTDGRPVTMWPNLDEAFLDVVTAIKRAMKELGQQPKTTIPAGWIEAAAALGGNDVIRSSNLRVRKQFTDLDRDRFLHDGFTYIAKFFENSLKELVDRNPGLDQRFRSIDANRFTAAAYLAGEKVCTGSASIAGGMLGGETVQYAMTDDSDYGGMNEAVMVKVDDQMLYFEALGMQSYGSDKEKLTMQGAAELFWGLFIQPLQR